MRTLRCYSMHDNKDNKDKAWLVDLRLSLARIAAQADCASLALGAWPFEWQAFGVKQSRCTATGISSGVSWP